MNFGKRQRGGFTLVELLVVVGIIAMLLAILLPTMNRARDQARAVQCASNLKQIAAALKLYLNDSKDVIPVAPDRWQWVTTTTPVKLISNVSASAYWGVAYLPYVAPPSIWAQGPDMKRVVYEASRKVFNCPSATGMSPAFSNTEQAPGHYGLNYCIAGKFSSSRWGKATRYKRSSETIFCHDAYEQRLEGSATYYPDTAGDMLSDFGGTAGNLLEWRLPNGEGVQNYTPGSPQPVREYYRHSNRCQVLWLDGHVSMISYSDGHDVPAAWYWGQESLPK